MISIAYSEFSSCSSSGKKVTDHMQKEGSSTHRARGVVEYGS
jgi:hypothetical protein